VTTVSHRGAERQRQTLTDDLAHGIGRVVHANTYDRIVAGRRTLAYVN
jgi:hypothetical protein